MNKYYILILVLFLLIVGVSWADNTDIDIDTDIDIVFPKNTLSVDLGATAFWLLFSGVSGVMNLIESADWSYDMFAIGVAAQYERLITEKIGISLNYYYGMMKIADGDFGFDMRAFSIAGNFRNYYYYKGQEKYFWEATLGYANVNLLFSPSAEEPVINSIAHYAKFGGKVGMRLDFNKPGGLVIEPAFGYYGVLGSGIRLGYEKDLPILGGMVNFLYDCLAAMLLSGGLGFSVGIGYSF
jgi:hypothetical protein